MTVDKFRVAWRLSGMNDGDATEVLGYTKPTVIRRNADNGLWMLKELRRLYHSLSEEGREMLVKAAVEYIRSPETD